MVLYETHGHILLYEVSHLGTLYTRYLGTLHTRYNYRGAGTAARTFAGATVYVD